ncbi:MAG: type II toxin-antitoxin system VapC family toxin [Dehalococcoidia bacterium]
MVILADSSVWIAHFRVANPSFTDLLDSEQVVTHPFVVGELACGSIPGRATFLRWLRGMRASPEASHAEALAFIQGRGIMGRGLGYGDVHLLASCKLASDTALWTFDRRLRAVAEELGIAFTPSSG